jgi:hypothetical protein
MKIMFPHILVHALLKNILLSPVVKVSLPRGEKYRSLALSLL